MMHWPAWRGWEKELTPRSVRLFIIAVLLGIGSAAGGFSPPAAIRADTSGLLMPNSARSDSLLTIIGMPDEVRRARSLSRRSYRRSQQIDLAIQELRGLDLLIPVPETDATDLIDSFDDARGGGARRHYAIDIHAPRGTPVLAVTDGRVLKLHNSRAGGLSVYTTDERSRYIYFYAHLDAYHADLVEGLPVSRGDTLGYVGTSGNAPPNTPHLHFQILKASNIARWSRGTPINPKQIWR